MKSTTHNRLDHLEKKIPVIRNKAVIEPIFERLGITLRKGYNLVYPVQYEAMTADERVIVARDPSIICLAYPEEPKG